MCMSIATRGIMTEDDRKLKTALVLHPTELTTNPFLLLGMSLRDSMRSTHVALIPRTEVNACALARRPTSSLYARG